MKLILKSIFYPIIVFIIFVVLYLLAAWIFSRISLNRNSTSAAEITIFIQTNGAHTDIVVPVKTDRFDWSKEIKYEHTVRPDTSMHYLALGWGNKSFYLDVPSWAELKYSIAIRAAIGMGETAMHATFRKSMKEDRSCKKIVISKEQYADLVHYISRSFKKDAKGHVIPIQTKSYYGTSDAFYEAKGSYHIFYTCNSWANTALKTAGQRCCLWTPFDRPIFDKY